MENKKLHDELMRQIEYIVKRNGYEVEADPLTDEMRAASKQLATYCAVASKVAAFSDDPDIKLCAKRLGKFSSDLLDNLSFPNMIERYVELVDYVTFETDDLEGFKAGVIVDYLRDAIEEAEHAYEEWKMGA